MPRTPITLITGPLGSGKTTLLRHILAKQPEKIAIVMNEFGEIAIDTKVIEGKNVRIAELGGGCVCCSLLGEFEAAVNEIIEKIAPERIVVETTGLAEPEALKFNIQEAQPQKINPTAAIVRTERCRVDPELLFGIGREKKIAPPEHRHQSEFESFAFTSSKIFSRDCFEGFANGLPASVVRAKGFIRFADGAQLFNFVAGRWEVDPFEFDRTELGFIGRNISAETSPVFCAFVGSPLPHHKTPTSHPNIITNHP